MRRLISLRGVKSQLNRRRFHWGRTLVSSSFRSDLKSDQSPYFYLDLIIKSCSLPNCDLDHKVLWSNLTSSYLDLSLFTWFFDCNFGKNYRVFQHALHTLHPCYQRVLHSGYLHWQCTFSVYCLHWSWFNVIFGGHYRSIFVFSICLSALFHQNKKIKKVAFSLFICIT